MDPEKPLRKYFSNSLSSFFKVWEEVNLKDKSGETIRADLLLHFQDETISTTIALELKSQPPAQPKNYRDTFYQAFKYVGAEVTDPRCPSGHVDFSVIYQDRMKWIRPRQITDPSISDAIVASQMDGIELAFNTLGVGILTEFEKKICFKFCSNSVWTSEKGWRAEFQRRGFFKEKQWASPY